MTTNANDIDTNQQGLVKASSPARSAENDAVRLPTAAGSASYDAKSHPPAHLNPTVAAYGHLIHAYAAFNEELFGGALPDCLITLQRKRGTYGFFHGERFGARDQTDIADEIALNPAGFAGRDDKHILSTLVHEMVHLWQHHHGNAPKSAYHNREWAAAMMKVGLTPSDTGKPGGRPTGRRVSHVIEVNGPFDRVCGELLRSGTLVAYVQRGDDESGETVRAKKAASKTRYTCGRCGLNAWAKPGIRLACEDCRQPLFPTTSGA